MPNPFDEIQEIKAGTSRSRGYRQWQACDGLGTLILVLTPGGLAAIKKARPDLLVECECCARVLASVRAEASRTLYAHDPKYPEDDPNADVWLCPECAKEHHANWDHVWSEYHAGLGAF